MRAPIALISLTLALSALPASATAQSWTPPDRHDPAVSTADQHRWEIERLRALSDANEALARRQRLETRLTLLELGITESNPLPRG